MAAEVTGSPMLYISAFFVTIATILGTGILVRLQCAGALGLASPGLPRETPPGLQQ